jgi:ankyrin repeat protein
MRRIVSAISTKDLQEILRNLSTNLDEVWGFCMERLDCQSPNRSALAKKAICWVTSALRPLTDEELTQALSYVPGDTDVDLTGSIDVSLLIEVCDGMLHLEPPTVTSTSTRPVISFTHASVADYISENVTIKAAHSDLANTCLGYLSLEDLKADDIQLNRHARYHFLDYAMTHWANHASRSGEEIKLTCLLKFARKSPSALFEAAKWGLDDALHYLLENSISPNRCHQTQRPLTVAAIYGRLLCVSYLVEAGADVNYAGDEDEVQDTALSHASRAGHSQVVLLLIDSDADLNAGSVPPLFAAVFERRGPIVRQLLSAGCDPNVRHNGETAIMAAVGSNLIDIAEMLMYGGADLNARYGTGGETILSTALWSRSWNFAIKLIGNGAAVTDRSALARALKYGAYEGAEGIVQAVLRFAKPGLSPLTDAEAESKTALEPASAHAHKTALHLALEGRHHDVASHLIDNGLGINQLCGNPPYTPLEWAAGRSEVSLVQQLIAAGADPNHGGQNSPLMSAVSRFVPADNFGDPCSTEVIALLLDAGADPHSRGVKESKDLMVRIDENIQYRWWRRQDPTLRRLQVTLQLQDDWVVP